MDNYFVSVIRPKQRSLTWEAYNWIAQNLETALRGLGHTALVVQDWLSLEATNILIGAHQMDEASLRTLPPDTILYNLAELAHERVSDDFLSLAERYRVWDDNPQNLPLWQSKRCAYPPVLMEIGYLPEMRTLQSRPAPDIDVLIFGSCDESHRNLIENLRTAGQYVVLTEGGDRPSTEALLARSKVVLKLHPPQTPLLEKVWTTYMLANSKAVLNEVSANGRSNESTPASSRRFPIAVPTEHIVEVCLDLVANQPKRHRLEAASFRYISQNGLRQTLATALPHAHSPSRHQSGRESRRLYLDMVQRSVLNLIYEDTDTLGKGSFDSQRRELGLDWPARAHSMIGNRRMTNLRQIAELAIESNIPGDFIETGVWRGGSCILMRAVLKAYGISDRRVWVADSFCGLPPPDPRYPADTGSCFHLNKELAIPLEEVQRNFAKYGLLDDQVCFLHGWFSETLPPAPIERLAILRLDGDLYQSTTDALTNLYYKVSEGGFIIVDDYEIPSCRKAISGFREQAGIIDAIQGIDGSGVFWRKTAMASIEPQADALALSSMASDLPQR